jgi:hypothetical protein
MSQQNAVIRATANVRTAQGKKDPSQTYGWQVCGLMTGGGMFQQFERMYSPSRGEKPLPEGDYEVVPKPAYVDRQGSLRIAFDLVAVKSAKAAA